MRRLLGLLILDPAWLLMYITQRESAVVRASPCAQRFICFAISAMSIFRLAVNSEYSRQDSTHRPQITKKTWSNIGVTSGRVRAPRSDGLLRVTARCLQTPFTNA